MKIITPIYFKNILMNSISKLYENKDLYLNNSEKAFSRTQKISFSDTILFPIVTSGESTPVEMLDFFPASNIPTQAALDYRRNQVKPSAFKDLFVSFSSKLPKSNTFHGMPIIACDGTRINTPYNPNDADSFVDCISDRKPFNQYHLNSLYDVLNNHYIDAIIQGFYQMDERLAFCEMIDRFSSDLTSIFTCDRGFASFNVVAHTINSGHHFVIRLTSSMAEKIFHDIAEKQSDESFDIEDEIYVGRKRTNKNKELHNYHFISSQKRYDFIPYGSEKIDHFRLRLVKFTPQGGNEEYLLTDLMQSEMSLSDLAEIYRLRWGIETSFRLLKYSAGMIHTHSIKPDFIFQEIYAKLICYNFCEAIMSNNQVESSDNTKYTYVTEKNYIFKVCIRFLKGIIGIKDMLSIIKKRKVPVRAGRKFERNVRRQHADTLQYR